MSLLSILFSQQQKMKLLLEEMQLFTRLCNACYLSVCLPIILEDEQFNDEKTYLIKQIKELHASSQQGSSSTQMEGSTG